MSRVEEKKPKTKLKILVIIIAILILIAIAITATYVIKRNYIVEKINQTNLIINNSNVTSSLKKSIYKENGVIYIAKPDIYNFFDNTIMYDEKYNQIITGSEKEIASLPIDSKQIQVNSSNVTIKSPAKIIDDVAYVPISELSEVYNIKTTYVESKDLVYIDSLDREQKIATLAKDSNIKYKPTNISATLAKAKAGDTLVIANRSDYPVPNGWTRVRTQDGTIGYIKTNKMGKENTIRQTIQSAPKVQGKVSLVWDYYSEYVSAPTRNGKIDGVGAGASSTACTRPTCPSSSITLMPWGWVGLFVRMRRTTPRVRLPVGWSFLSTISTCCPGRMSARRLPSMGRSSLPFIECAVLPPAASPRAKATAGPCAACPRMRPQSCRAKISGSLPRPAAASTLPRGPAGWEKTTRPPARPVPRRQAYRPPPACAKAGIRRRKRE